MQEKENDRIHPNAVEYKFQERYAQLKNVRLYYEGVNLGKKDKTDTAILLLHGWTANRFRIHPLYLLYEQAGNPTFRLDLRGHGWSQKEGIKDWGNSTRNRI